MAAAYDVAVIGGGVIGCTVLHELTQKGFSCVLCERNSDLVAESSCGSSSIIHTGYDALPDTSECQFLQTSQQLNQEYYEKFNIPYKRIGAMIVAWNEEELKQLPGIVEQAHKNGITSVCQISKEQLLEKEPNLSQDALGAVCIPGEGVVDPWLLPIMMAHTAKQKGAKILLGCNLLNGSQDKDGNWLLITNTGQIKVKAVVNCAGLHGDTVEKINKQPSFQIFPRKGQYIVYDDKAGSLLNSIILPIATRKTKGTLLFPSVYGHLVVGPTAEEQPNRDKWPVNSYTSHSLETYGHKILPELSKHSPVAAYAGLRPATQYRDYQLATHTDRKWITIGGIRSTGLSACTGLAQYVGNQMQSELGLVPHTTSGSVEIAQQSDEGDDKHGENNNMWNLDDKHQDHLVLSGAKYRITHPLSRLGLDPSSKL
ncbi:glycerol 3-phosphate dehydrogenase-like [Amphiura filiformis]|uniref:glycerol 3-phosphate dehydrogenase-like n=1 Tax=Amphiura filiformis TaxID=82378 RepID=UPI003B225F4C